MAETFVKKDVLNSFKKKVRIILICIYSICHLNEGLECYLKIETYENSMRHIKWGKGQVLIFWMINLDNIGKFFGNYISLHILIFFT